MMKIEAIIRPTKVDDVKAALDELGVKGMTLTHVMGAGRQRGRTQYYRGQEYTVHLLDKIKLETVVVDSMVGDVVNAILEYAATGEIGDGKIFLTKLEDAIRIRTREHGDAALS
ncbi:MAG: P-II family nitrogen regulator [Armatimonadetes bacterium]|nr:P-II family nitrogen regulator [Armatimonadota bacterium]